MTDAKIQIKENNRSENIKLFFLGVGLIFVDQLSKNVVRLYDKGGFYICNEGIGFGIKIPELIFFSLWTVAVIFLAHSVFLKKKYILRLISCVFILSGAVSNMFDRFAHGCIIDFIDLKIWPVFNLADIFIVIGFAGFIYSIQKTKSFQN
ncbi:MAG: Lipoprotein signal peptidase [Candidatus Moranbacteria bacterium GW2011_GWE2_35_2-]|nr:MAG: Lipoprotein signal peptidase [Candidatus Moranbacteria bacterium GW2011_GWE2_35_2-]KKQ04299.1 MAG: Lipoprotein signal peptidase [Candidatus Moranbacteria bacterium GW2011_GWF1_36_4]KKQ22510.1 MAG: Lipoprotein signal peptidase [Candidatus Moranbacteria bacterium GW2011_GWF2_37_11]KKQ29579.1 MAG: Lipoprotein signal peptidase [Candidatus Moranbacteria bacterium GW2011_GWD1_37_17]KKQ30550.1 MAG: Lipoprotein signal peptidase [Candidatus Moranbacteria bacterium GW2011_GWE1_37_24]KKQ47244.1 M